MRQDQFYRPKNNYRSSTRQDVYDLTRMEEGGVDFNRNFAYSIRMLFEEALLVAENREQTQLMIAADEELLIWAMDSIAHSPAGFALIRRAADHGWSIGLGDLGTGGFYLDIPEKCLLVDHNGFSAEALVRSLYFRNALILNIIKGLREIWQDTRFGALERDFKPEALLLLERVRAADSDTLCVLVAWEMRAAGLPDIWRHLLGSEEGDMAAVFSNILERDPSSFMNGSALAQVFRQWFADDMRINACDHESLEAMDMVLEWAKEEKGGKPPFGSRTISNQIVEQMSCIPGGQAYLQGLGKNIIVDPAFSSLNDPINESYLFHIVYDSQVTIIENVPFRDLSLAKKIFPHQSRKKAE